MQHQLQNLLEEWWKAKIVKILYKRKSIAKTLVRDPNTIKECIWKQEPVYDAAYADMDVCLLLQWMENHLKIEKNKHLLKSSKELFTASWVPNVPKISQCHISKHLEICTKPNVCSPLKLNHLAKYVSWDRKYLKLDFQRMLFMDYCKAIMLDEPVGT